MRQLYLFEEKRKKKEKLVYSIIIAFTILIDFKQNTYTFLEFGISRIIIHIKSYFSD